MSGHAAARDTKEYWYANNPEFIKRKKKKRKEENPPTVSIHLTSGKHHKN